MQRLWHGPCLVKLKKRKKGSVAGTQWTMSVYFKEELGRYYWTRSCRALRTITLYGKLSEAF